MPIVDKDGESHEVHSLTLDELNLVERLSRRYARQAARKVLRNYVLGVAVAFLLVLGGLVYVTHLVTQKSFHARGVVCQIIKQGDYQAYQYQADGTISDAQLKRALKQSVEYRKLLAPAENCDTEYTNPLPRRSIQRPAASAGGEKDKR